MTEHSLFEIIRQRPLPELTDDAPICPYCESPDVMPGAQEMTTVGGRGNHGWEKCLCERCNGVFTRETKDYDGPGHVWYTKKLHGAIKGNLVIKGVHGCYENYLYDCAKCEGGLVGKVKPRIFETVGMPEGTKYPVEKGKVRGGGLVRVSDGAEVHKNYIDVWACNSCGASAEIDDVE